MTAPGAGNGSTNQTILINYNYNFWEFLVDIFAHDKYKSYDQLKIEFINDKLQLKRLIIVIGGADYFYGNNEAKPTISTHDDELINLVTYLKSINAHKPDNPNEWTIVLLFDKAYKVKTINNDFTNLNKKIFETRKFFTNIDFIQDYEANIEEYALGGKVFFEDSAKDSIDYQKGLPQWNPLSQDFDECRIGNIYFNFFQFNFETKYKKKDNDLYKLRDKPISTLGNECKPKPGSLFERLQKFCERTSFEEYYLYHCAWIGGRYKYKEDNDYSLVSSNPVHNRYLEEGCEFLYIFTHLTKPSFLLTFGYLHTFKHKNEKQVGQLFITPINSTTTFKNNSWKLKYTSGGKRRTITRKQKKRSRKYKR